MKFLHTSDWHLGAADSEIRLQDDQKYFIDEICRIVQESAVDAVLIAGDVYDRSVASAEAIRLYNDAIETLSRAGVDVCIIAGNHDSAERLACLSGLLAASGVHICGSPEESLQPVSLKDTEIFLLPWITEEKVKSLFPEQKTEIASLEDAYRIMTDKMRSNFTAGKKHIAVSHAFITNAETSRSDRAAEIGFAPQVSASVFDGFDYVALGHIHKGQDIAPHIRYCGTPMPYSFGKEETQEKSVTVVDTSDMTKEVIPLSLLHRRKTVTGTLEEVLSVPCSEEERNGYVRIQITDAYVGPETNARLRQIYPHPLEISGKVYEGENSSITLTMEDLEELEENPVEVFRYFCREETETDPDDHLIAMFERAMHTAEEGRE